MEKLKTLTAQFLEQVRNEETESAYSTLNKLAHVLAVYSLSKRYEKTK